MAQASLPHRRQPTSKQALALCGRRQTAVSGSTRPPVSDRPRVCCGPKGRAPRVRGGTRAGRSWLGQRVGERRGERREPVSRLGGYASADIAQQLAAASRSKPNENARTGTKRTSVCVRAREHKGSGTAQASETGRRSERKRARKTVRENDLKTTDPRWSSAARTT